MDTLCHRVPNFIDKAVRAGVRRVFVGLENINPDNLLAANKKQNKITEYRTMFQQWHERGVFTWRGYILGFPADTKESILRDIEIIKRELPVDILEFFFLTPLPGSEDHRKLHEAGAWMDPDLNKYDLHHRVSHHAKMSDAEWEETYKAAWDTYFTWEHMETVGRRHARLENGRPHKAIQYMNEFRMLYENEGVHTLEGGVARRKRRRSRRPGLKREPAIVFYPNLALEMMRKAFSYWSGYQKAKGDHQARHQRSRALQLHRSRPAEDDRGRIRQLRHVPEDQGRDRGGREEAPLRRKRKAGEGTRKIPA